VAHPDQSHPDKPVEGGARRDENGVLIVNVGELRKEPEPDPSHVRPSTDSPGAEGGTAGTGAEHTEQDQPG
jgi:hypothetical protein